MSFPRDTQVGLDTPFSNQPEPTFTIAFKVPNIGELVFDVVVIIGVNVATALPQKKLISLGFENYMKHPNYNKQHGMIFATIYRSSFNPDLYSVAPRTIEFDVPTGKNSVQQTGFTPSIDWPSVIAYNGVTNGVEQISAYIYGSKRSVNTWGSIYVPPQPVTSVVELLTLHQFRRDVFSEYIKRVMRMDEIDDGFTDAVDALQNLHDLPVVSSNIPQSLLPDWMKDMPAAIQSMTDTATQMKEQIASQIQTTSSDLKDIVDKFTAHISDISTSGSQLGGATIIKREIKKCFRVGNSVLDKNPEFVTTGGGLELPRIHNIVTPAKYAVLSTATNVTADSFIPFAIEQGWSLVLAFNVLGSNGERLYTYFSGQNPPVFIQ